MPRADGELETYLTLLLADQNPALAAAHDEVYPERITEGIPFSLTLLYPFATRAEVDRYLESVRTFLADESSFGFELVDLAQWEDGGAVYAVPEPEQPLRNFMRRLWRRFLEFPPYREAGADPPPHASLTYTGGEDRAATRIRVERRLEGLLPAPFSVTEVALMEEAEADRWRLRETFRLGA